MTKPILTFLTAALPATPAIYAQQSPSPQPPQAQMQHAPCGATTPSLPKPPKWLHFKLPPDVQREIEREKNKIQQKVGSTVDINGAIHDATAPKPCQPMPAPSPAKSAPPQDYTPQ